MVLTTEAIEKMDLFILHIITNKMKTLIQKLLFGYRPNADATEPKKGSILKYKGHNAETIHSALVLLKFQIENEKN
jgi:hypothetical protein